MAENCGERDILSALAGSGRAKADMAESMWRTQRPFKPVTEATEDAAEATVDEGPTGAQKPRSAADLMKAKRRRMLRKGKPVDPKRRAAALRAAKSKKAKGSYKKAWAKRAKFYGKGGSRLERLLKQYHTGTPWTESQLEEIKIGLVQMILEMAKEEPAEVVFEELRAVVSPVVRVIDLLEGGSEPDEIDTHLFEEALDTLSSED